MSAGVFVRAVEGGCHVVISAKPGAAMSEIEGEDTWRKALKVKIGAQPERGTANDELVRFLSEKLSVRGTEITIVRGSRSHRKVVFVPLTPEETIKRLGMS